jgi:DNA primase
MLLESKVLSLLNEVIGHPARLRKGGVQAVYFCKFCNHYKRKLEVNLSTGEYHCWVCDTKGIYLGSLFKKLKAAPIYNQRLFELTKDIRLKRRTRIEVTESLVLPPEFIPLSRESSSPEYKNAIWYLKKRKVLDLDIVRYNIGYCEEGEYQNRLIIPSYDSEGNLNFYIGRRYYDMDCWGVYRKPPCSMNIVGFECFINYNEPLNIVEGPFDAIAVRNNAIPLFGKYLSKKLKEAIIINEVKQINMILDNDALKDALRNSLDLLKLGIDVHLIKLDGKDPSVIGFEKMNQLIEESKSLDFDEIIQYKLM